MGLLGHSRRVPATPGIPSKSRNRDTSYAVACSEGNKTPTFSPKSPSAPSDCQIFVRPLFDHVADPRGLAQFPAHRENLEGTNRDVFPPSIPEICRRHATVSIMSQFHILVFQLYHSAYALSIQSCSSAVHHTMGPHRHHYEGAAPPDLEKGRSKKEK